MGDLSILSIVFVTVIFIALPMFIDVQKYIGSSEMVEGNFSFPSSGFSLPSGSGPSGYTFYPGMDSKGYNMMKKNNLADMPGLLKLACNANPNCKGFSTKGWLKNNIRPQEEWSNWTSNSGKGLYVRNGPGAAMQDAAMRGGSVFNVQAGFWGNGTSGVSNFSSGVEGGVFDQPGMSLPTVSLPDVNGGNENNPINRGFVQKEYVFYPGMDSGGYDIMQNPNLSVNQLMSECNAADNCKGFNTNGWLKNTIRPYEDWSKWSTDPAKGFYIDRNSIPSDAWYCAKPWNKNVNRAPAARLTSSGDYAVMARENNPNKHRKFGCKRKNGLWNLAKDSQKELARPDYLRNNAFWDRAQAGVEQKFVNKSFF